MPARGDLVTVPASSTRRALLMRTLYGAESLVEQDPAQRRLLAGMLTKHMRRSVQGHGAFPELERLTLNETIHHALEQKYVILVPILEKLERGESVPEPEIEPARRAAEEILSILEDLDTSGGNRLGVA